MKFLNNVKKYFLTPVLVLSMVCGTFSITPIYAEENDTDQTETTTADDSQPENEETMNSEISNEEAENISVETKTQEEKSKEVDEENEHKADTQSDEDSPLSTEKNEVYTMSVTFDGQTLDEDSSKNTGFTWSNTNTKNMSIKLERNNSVEEDKSKNYIVCIKTPEPFYFNGLPEAKNINGIEEVGFVKNACPKVYNLAGQQIDLPGFSDYSGEIRLRLNPSITNIEIPNIGVNYNQELIGYTGNSQEIRDILSCDLVAVDNGKSLDQFDQMDETKINGYQVYSASIKTASLSGSNMKNSMSVDGFKTNGINEQNMQTGKAGTIAYAGGTAGQAFQYYKDFVVKFNCPYIEENGKTYYLDFNTNDSALTENKQGSKTGFHMASKASYNEADHTITYTFKEIYLGGHTVLFYSPVFSWPSELKNQEIDKNYQINGAGWSIEKQTCYTGKEASLIKEFKAGKYHASFIPNGVNVTLISSDQASSDKKIAKRSIYKEVTRENKVAGMLGFFDVHNDGTEDSPEVKITIKFNTDFSDRAKYYITQVNLPVYASGETEIQYELENDNGDITTGTKQLNTAPSSNPPSIFCKASELGSGYIKELSYTTKLAKGTAYHKETAHLWRNRVEDSGVYFGYLEGDVDSTAHAEMTIESVDTNKALNYNGDTSISTTEKSTISDGNDYIAFSLRNMTVANGQSREASITAGESVKLQFGATINSEEYALDRTQNTVQEVNGYHVFRNGVFYICLPIGVSILGPEYVDVRKSDQRIDVGAVTKLENSQCTVNGQTAQWWEIQVNNINQSGGKYFTVEVQLDTDIETNNLSWNFQNCVAVRSKDQAISWGAAEENKLYNSGSELSKSNVESIQALGQYLLGESDATNKLGLKIYTDSTKVAQLTIARAEAKLDVKTGIKMDGETVDQSSVKLSNEGTILSYDVTVSSVDDGHANDFSYYIPIVSTDSQIDKNSFVVQNNFSLALNEAVGIEKNNINPDEDAIYDLPFSVSYTTDRKLTGSNVRDNSVHWKSESECENFSDVTAVRITTKPTTIINSKESFTFSLKLKYLGDGFNSEAGNIVKWRSFGHYTYTRNGATTTSTYPSEINQVTIRYEKDLTKNPMNVTLDTSGNSNSSNAQMQLENSFKNAQTFVVKKVTPVGVELINEDPKNLTGTKANTQFNVAFNINNVEGAAAQLTKNGTDKSKQWNIEGNNSNKPNLQTEVKFSKALTDTATPRYIDVTIGNENVDITFRIQLIREVKPAAITGSGVSVGANYQIPPVSDTCQIGKKSSFTALYVVDNFIPGNYENQSISFGNSSFAANTKITMMEISNDKISSYWYYKANGQESSVDLKSFKRMSGRDPYSYDTKATSQTKLGYLFVVDFSDASMTSATYNFTWKALAKDNGQSMEISFPITVLNEKEYRLSGNTENGIVPKATISYEITDVDNDSYIAHKSLSLVLKPKGISELPKDAKIVCEDKTYSKNSLDEYIIPVEGFASGSKALALISEMFPDEEKEYSFMADLYLANSKSNNAPNNGIKVAEIENLSFHKSELKIPSLGVTGKRSGTVDKWEKGQKINIDMENIANGKLTVTAYSGLKKNRKVTDLLSNVGGLFDINSGVGIYNSEYVGNKTLKLSQNAKPGTYCLLFEVKDDNESAVLQVPYYIIVK